MILLESGVLALPLSSFSICSFYFLIEFTLALIIIRVRIYSFHLYPCCQFSEKCDPNADYDPVNTNTLTPLLVNLKQNSTFACWYKSMNGKF